MAIPAMSAAQRAALGCFAALVKAGAHDLRA
jgi:hypothetical protein